MDLVPGGGGPMPALQLNASTTFRERVGAIFEMTHVQASSGDRSSYPTSMLPAAPGSGGNPTALMSLAPPSHAPCSSVTAALGPSRKRLMPDASPPTAFDHHLLSTALPARANAFLRLPAHPAKRLPLRGASRGLRATVQLGVETCAGGQITDGGCLQVREFTRRPSGDRSVARATGPLGFDPGGQSYSGSQKYLPALQAVSATPSLVQSG